MGYSVTKHESTAVKEVQYENYLDHVYAVSDDDGDLIEHYRYTAFGEVTIYNELGNQVANTQINNQILWNTRRRDEVTGYYMYKFRHYSAELGRWPSRDPIGEKGGVNLYAFCFNDPYNWWDKLGNNPILDWAARESERHRSGGYADGNPYHPRYDPTLIPRLSSYLDQAIAVVASAPPTDRAYGMSAAIRNLKNNYMPSSIRFGTNQRNPASYRAFGDAMFFRDSSPDLGAVVHEMVHSFNDQRRVFNMDVTRDEGMAYIMQWMYQSYDRVSQLEDDLIAAGGNCSKLRDETHKWTFVLSSLVKSSEIIVNDVSQGNLTSVDFTNVQTLLGVTFSAGAMAEHFNKMENVKKCCIKFTLDVNPAKHKSKRTGKESPYHQGWIGKGRGLTWVQGIYTETNDIYEWFK